MGSRVRGDVGESQGEWLQWILGLCAGEQVSCYHLQREGGGGWRCVRGVVEVNHELMKSTLT